MDLNATPDNTNSASDAKLNQALASLDRHVGSVYGDLAAPDMEKGFLQALQRQPVSSIGRYQCYTDFSKPDETVVMVHDATGHGQHKYIFAKTQDHTYIVCAPVNWTE